MKTRITKKGDTVIVSMTGQLTHESQEPLRNDLERLMEETATDIIPKKFIFNFEDLEFVGSSGITSFVKTLKEFNRKAAVKPKYCHVGSEFQRIFQVFGGEEALFEFYEDEGMARSSYDN